MSFSRVCPFSKTSVPDFANGAGNSLPVWYHDSKHTLHKVSDDTGRFFADDLDVSRLNRIQKDFIGLRLAGRYKAVARPLHRQLIMNRRVIVTERADLHLTWDGNGIYIKPLPAYLFDGNIWTTNLCQSASLYQSACGLLLSYIWLLTHETDFRLAVTHEIPLLPFPEKLTWSIWRELVQEMSYTIDVDARTNVSPRYAYGELRLDRLNLIYRFSPAILFSKKHTIIRGYFYSYNQYSNFFSRNFSWLIAVFAYVSIVLSAMQVGLASSRLGSNADFQNASYGFTVFALVVPLTSVGVVGATFVIIFTSNLLATLKNWARHTKKPQQSQPTHSV